MLFFAVISFSLTSVFTTRSSDATNGKVVRGRFCDDQKPGTFNQPWTTEEQVGVDSGVLLDGWRVLVGGGGGGAGVWRAP